MHSNIKDRETREWTTNCCMLPYSEADLIKRAKVDPETLVKRDEAEFGNWSNATRLFGFSECVDRRQDERKIHLRRNPHYFCDEYVKDINNGTLPLFFCDEHKALDHILPVKVLGLCRQIYIEANPILWSTNTFGFSNAGDFVWFMSDRISAQKASITSLLVDLSPNSMYADRYLPGPSVTTNEIITSLVSLRTLHLYLQDNNCFRYRLPAQASELLIQQHLRQWQYGMEMYRRRFIDFKRLPLQEVTVLMPEHRTKPLRDVPDWYHAEQIKYTESVRDAILDPNGAQDFLRKQASDKAKKDAEMAWWRANKAPPCQQASSEEECARLNQAIIDNQRIMKGKPKSSKPRAQACNLVHVCIICVQIRGITMQMAKRCKQPGNCNKAYLNVMFKHQSRPTKTRKLLLQRSDTMRIALDKYFKASGAFKTDSFYLQIGGISLKEEYTVKDLGLQQDNEVEVVDVAHQVPN